MKFKKPEIRAYVIALTGGIASGKTAVSDAFSKLGVSVVDTDVIAREVVRPGSTGLKTITDNFGTHLLNNSGELDRRTLRNIIFADADKRELLESILHPMIRAESITQLQAANTTLALLVIPLLAETQAAKSAYQWVDRILLIDVPEASQISRLIARDHINKQQAQAILNAQASRQQRLAIADDVLLNNKDLVTLQTSITELFNKYTQLALDRSR